MKKRITFLSLLASVLLLPFQGMGQKTETERLFSCKGYQHRVKSIGSQEEISYYKYDESGRLIQRYTEIPKGTLAGMRKFSYDAEGRLSLIETLTTRESTGEVDLVVRKEIYSYDDKGRMFKMLEKRLIDPREEDGTLFEMRSCQIVKWDEQDRPLEGEVLLKGESETLQRLCRITYDEKGRISTVKHFNPNALEDPDKGFIMGEEFTYNDKGNLTEEVHTTDKGKVNTYPYEYDEKGNMIKTGDAAFPFTYTYSESQLMEKTYFPSMKTICNGMLEQFINCTTTISYIPVLPNVVWSYNAPLKENDMLEINYEDVPVLSNELIKDLKDDCTILIANGLLQVLGADSYAGETIYIYNVLGELVKIANLDEEGRVAITELGAGTYVVRVKGGVYKFLL